MGITCALGTGVETVRKALVGSQPGIVTIQGIAGLHKPFLGGQIQRSNAELLQQANCENFPTNTSRTTALALLALQDLLANSNFQALPNSAFLNASSVGGMDVTEIEHLKKDGHQFENYLQHPIGKMTNDICTHFDWPIFRTTISTACSSSANTLMMAGRAIRADKYDRIIAGGTDALSLFTIRGFDSLRIYDEQLCRPFDEQRAGLNLGEGAAYLLLESEDSLKTSGNTPIAELAGWANANDAYHQTASSPEGRGAYDSMTKALKCATLKPEEIDYINAHGTATPNNDMSEAIAMSRIFDSVPAFSSTKAMTGHTLAAAGAIEAIFSSLSIQDSMVWGNLNHVNKMEEPALVPALENTKLPGLRNVLSNSFGFGGNNSTVIIRST